MSEQEKLDRVLWFAQKELGTKEIPAGSNKVKYNDWFYGKPVEGVKYPWCGTSVSWLYSMAGFPLGTIDYLKGFAGVPYAIEHIDKWGKFVSAKDAKPGYIVFYKFKNAKGFYEWAHTGILETYIVHDIFDAYEGNTGIGNDSNGGEFMSRNRKYSPEFVLIARPNCLDIPLSA